MVEVMRKKKPEKSGKQDEMEGPRMIRPQMEWPGETKPQYIMEGPEINEIPVKTVKNSNMIYSGSRLRAFKEIVDGVLEGKIPTPKKLTEAQNEILRGLRGIIKNAENATAAPEVNLTEEQYKNIKEVLPDFDKQINTRAESIRKQNKDALTEEQNKGVNKP